MTQKDYMMELKEKLRFMDEDARQKALDFYREALDDRMEDGMDEASAVAAMESPDDIAARLMSESGASQNESPAEEKESRAENAEPLTDEAMKFSSLVDSVLKAAEKAMEKAADTAAQVEAQADGMAEQIVKEADTLQDQAAKASSGEYEKVVFTCAADHLRAIRLIGGEMPIQVRACEGEDVTLIYYTCEDDPYEAEVKNGVLTLQRGERGNMGAGRFVFSMLGGVIRMCWNKSCPTVELEIPRNALLDLEARTSNASIKVNGPKALCDVNLKTSNSRIALEDVTCKALEAASSNGRLLLEQVETKQTLNGKTSNSRIEAKRVKVGGDLILRTSNGRVEAADAIARKELRLTTSNGRIYVERSDGGAVHLTTSNSGISGILPGCQQDWQISSGTSNGRNSLPTAQPGGKPLNVHTSNGSIDLHFEA